MGRRAARPLAIDRDLHALEVTLAPVAHDLVDGSFDGVVVGAFAAQRGARRQPH